MSIVDYFKPVDSMTADEVRDFLREKNPGEYNLVDVRQPSEYEKGHLPGAVLIPLGELRERAGELNSRKPTILY
ncbi:MAG: rhodanese-like domain-containing protein [Nitrospirota bacterium]